RTQSGANLPDTSQSGVKDGRAHDHAGREAIVGCKASHRTGSTRRTSSSQASAPTKATTPVTPNARRELPLSWTIRPAVQGATIPERLATPFCRLDHRPAKLGPASVCAIAQWLDAKIPYPTDAMASTAREREGLLRINASAARDEAMPM